MRKLIHVAYLESEGDHTREQIINIKKAGFDGVFLQWYNFPGLDISFEDQVKLCNELRLSIEFAHLEYREMEYIWMRGEKGDQITEGFIKDLNDCKRNGIDLVVMHTLRRVENTPAPNELGLERWKRIVKEAEKLGVKIALENTRLEVYLDYLFKHIKSKNIGLCFDSGHYHCNYKDDFDLLKYKNRVLAVHLHDNNSVSDEHLIPFNGTNDWNKIIKMLRKVNYKGPITLENYRFADDDPKEPLEYFKKARKAAIK